MPDNAPSEETLARYFAGELSPPEAAGLDDWLNADPNRRAQMEALRDVWSRTADQPSDERVDQVWANLSTKLGLEKPRAPVSLVKPRRSTPIRALRLNQPRRTAWIAASLATAAAAAIVLFALRLAPPTNPPPSPEPQFHEYATKNAQRADIRLSDGSRVVLAPASRLLVPDDYGTKTRSLTLEGEAYFDVVHGETKPFSVRSPHTLTRDIGTAFAVTDYANDQTARVLVASGEVAVLSAKDTTASTLQLLEPGDLALVTATGTVTRTRVANVQRRLAWLRGGLAFDDALLGDAVREIGRWYDLDIRLADSSLARRQLVATIGDEPADDVLRLVALTLKLRYEREGRAVTFYPK